MRSALRLNLERDLIRLIDIKRDRSTIDFKTQNAAINTIDDVLRERFCIALIEESDLATNFELQHLSRGFPYEHRVVRHKRRSRVDDVPTGFVIEVDNPQMRLGNDNEAMNLANRIGRFFHSNVGVAQSPHVPR